jgi:hypothetical protein
VCSYCGCRALVPIAELTEEHVQILSLSADIRRAVGRGEHVVAAALLATLTDVLELHDAVEELALYPAMARDPELAEKVGTLFDEHDELDRVVRCTLAATAADPSTAAWVACSLRWRCWPSTLTTRSTGYSRQRRSASTPPTGNTPRTSAPNGCDGPTSRPSPGEH